MMRHLYILAFTALPGTAIADPSLECSMTSGSQVEIADCMIDAETAVNAALQVALDTARSAAVELDEITEREAAGPALEASQNTWMDLRETHCAFEGSMFGGGSGTGIAIQACRISMTRDRIKELFSLVQY